MQTAAALPTPPLDPIARLLAELAHAPERDPRVARASRVRPGDTVGRFEIVRELGRGGFGVVFEARDTARRRRVAVKVARPGARGRLGCESLRRELALSRLRHPNLVAVLGGGRCARGPFVVLEYLSGETLADRLARGPLPVEEAIEIATAVARGLSHAHGQGVLHRDVKPANVFLPESGGAKLIDFGLARVGAAGGPRGSGTSRYMSPEQRAGAPEDPRSDLFALGLLLHEMLTGSPRLARDGTRAPAAHPLRPRPGVPLALLRLAAALAESDPALRPASAGAVLLRLETIRERQRTEGRASDTSCPAREGKP